MTEYPPPPMIEKPQGVRVFELLVYVTGPLYGHFKTWPAQIQDGIHEALERLSQREQLPMCLLGAACEIDHNDSTDLSLPDKYFVRVQASEIVVKDVTQDVMIARAMKESGLLL